MVVSELVILELKSVEKIGARSFQTAFTYLRLAGLPLGLLINFGEAILKNGIHRVVD